MKPIYNDFKKINSPRTALAALAKHLPTFLDPDLVIGATIPAREVGEGLIAVGYYSPGREASALMGDAYAYGWVRAFHWIPWSETPVGRRLLRDPFALAQASKTDLARVVTVCMREAHWGMDALEQRFREGLLTRIIHRAAVLHAEMVVKAIIARCDDPVTRGGVLQLLADGEIDALACVTPWQSYIDTVEDPHFKVRMQTVLDERYEGYDDLLSTLRIQVDAEARIRAKVRTCDPMVDASPS